MKHKFHRQALYFILRFLMLLSAILPYRVTVGLGGALGRFSWRILPRERRKTLGHLKLAFGNEKSEKEIEAIGLRTFDHYGRLLAEWVKIDHIIAHVDEYVTTEGYEHLDRSFAAGKGTVIVAAHFGNWELMAGHGGLKGYPASGIGRRLYLKHYDRLITEMRLKMKLQTIYRDEHPRRMLEALHQNRMVGFVVDQAIEDVDAIQVEFFGKLAWTPVAPVRFARASGAQMIPTFIIREGLKHRIVVEPPIMLVDTGDRKADLLTNTKAWVAVQERYIRRYPHLWVWNHKRWKDVNISAAKN